MVVKIESIPIISVSYNSAELISDLLGSIRSFYSNPIIIIDGSDENNIQSIKELCDKYDNVELLHFNYNIHHGPGMAWAFQNLNLKGPVLVLDSDIFILKHGFIEDLFENLSGEMYGVGYVNHVNEGGFDVDYEDGSIPYLHPACMLVNMEVVNLWPMPTKHGAPMIEPMSAIYREGKSNLIKGVEWVKNDFSAKNKEDFRYYLRHDWQGTVKRSGSYNLDEWTKDAAYNSVIRGIIFRYLNDPKYSVMEFGGNNGLLSRQYKEKYPHSDYFYIRDNQDKTSFDGAGCGLYLKKLDQDFFAKYPNINYWIFDKIIEYLEDPVSMLMKIRNQSILNSRIIAVIPNSQHWTLQLRILSGDLNYSSEGLLGSKIRRFYSRSTMIQLFKEAGWSVIDAIPVIQSTLNNSNIEAAIKNLLMSLGLDYIKEYELMQADAFVIVAEVGE